MTDLTNTTDRDEVLFAFHEAFDQPTAQDIIEWVRRYPQFAEDIREHAAIAWDWATRAKGPEEPVDETMSARGYSQALNIIYSSELASASSEALPSKRTFQQMQEAIGKQTHEIARDLDISRAVLSDLFNGWMSPPIRKRVSDSLRLLFSATAEEFKFALDSALQAPRLGHAESTHTPVIVLRSCDEIILDSSMSAARKRYWLEED